MDVFSFGHCFIDYHSFPLLVIFNEPEKPMATLLPYSMNSNGLEHKCDLAPMDKVLAANYVHPCVRSPTYNLRVVCMYVCVYYNYYIIICTL